MSSSIGVFTQMMAEYNYKALLNRQVRVRSVHGDSFNCAHGATSRMGGNYWRLLFRLYTAGVQMCTADPGGFL